MNVTTDYETRLTVSNNIPSGWIVVATLFAALVAL